MTPEKQLESMGITLPPVAVPAAAYVPFVRSGSLVFISGHIAKSDGKPWVGQLGLNMNTAEGKAAAAAVAVDLMGTLKAAAGELSRVKRIVKLLSLVNSTPTYTEHHLVTNGCSVCSARSSAPRSARMRAALLASRNCRWALAWKSN